MSTRADFYVGTGKDAEWLGSIAFDGYPAGLSSYLNDHKMRTDLDTCPILTATTEKEYRAAVANRLQLKDGTTPEMGWPWPWENSAKTGYAYTFCQGQDAKGKVMGYAYGMFDPLQPEPEWDTIEDIEAVFEKSEWPDMTDRQQVTWGSRSGLLVLAGR